MYQLYKDILIEQKIEKFDNYFTADCTIQVNDKVFNAEEFKQRMQKMKENIKSIKVEMVNFFISQDESEITDTHISTARDLNGVERKLFVMQQSKLEGNKIKNFIDVYYVI